MTSRCCLTCGRLEAHPNHVLWCPEKGEPVWASGCCEKHIPMTGKEKFP